MKKIVWMVMIFSLGSCIGGGAKKTAGDNLPAAGHARPHVSLAPDSKWLGEYELSFSLGRINDSTEVFADYALSVGRDSVSFVTVGYKMYYEYQCTMSEHDGRLIIFCDKLADGVGELVTGDTLAILTSDAGDYYIESPVIYDDPDAAPSAKYLLTKNKL